MGTAKLLPDTEAIKTADPALAKLDARIAGLREARVLLADCRRIVRFHWQAERPWTREAFFAIVAARDRMGRDLKKAKQARDQHLAQEFEREIFRLDDARRARAWGDRGVAQ